ncbi:MAG: hypothetical protein AB7V58_10135 [Solirubrobacterales bacterium]
MLALLERLHRHKDAAYGDAWRKRGEVIAIFANMARKYDRLVVAFSEQRAAATEPLADTVADLCVYAGKYLTWLADEHPDELDDAGLPLPPAATISDANGPDALRRVFAAIVAAPTSSPEDSPEAWRRVQDTFATLERGLMAQAKPGSPHGDSLSVASKAGLAWALVQNSASLLALLDAEDPARLEKLRDEIAQMDDAARP